MKLLPSSRSKLDHGNTKFFLTLFGVTLVLLLAWYAAIQWHEQQLLRREKVELEQKYKPQVAVITDSINHHFAYFPALKTFLLVNIDSQDRRSDFQQFSESILETSPAIRSVQFFPREGTAWAYPIEGNEATQERTLAMLIDDERPNVAADVARALETRRVTLSCPYELRQGGLGLLARQAIYSGDTLEGIVVIIIDVPILLENTGLNPESDFYTMALQTQAGETFSGDARVFVQQPVLFSLSLPECEWTLAVIPASGWRSSYLPELRTYQWEGLALVLLLSTVFGLGLRHRNYLKDENKRLTRTVAEKTALLQSSITELEEAKLQLQRHETQLEKLVEKGTEELTHSYERLKLALQHREIVLNNMSHELKTPLTAILGMTELMLRHDRESMDEKQIQSLETIQTSGERLLITLNNLLDLAKMNADKMEIHLQQTGFKVLCEQLAQQVTARAQLKNISFEMAYASPHIDMLLDPVRIQQALMCILDNAIKFTPEGGNIGMRVQDEGNWLDIHIWDTGIGLSEDDIIHLYEPFFQADGSLTRPYEGAGLGLPVAEGLILLHQGQISVHSTPGQGSRFTVKLPITV